MAQMEREPIQGLHSCEHSPERSHSPGSVSSWLLCGISSQGSPYSFRQARLSDVGPEGMPRSLGFMKLVVGKMWGSMLQPFSQCSFGKSVCSYF